MWRMFVKRLAWLIAVCFVGPEFSYLQAAPAPVRPNVVFILADDMYVNLIRPSHFTHEKQGISLVIVYFRTTPNCVQFLPIP
jgi:hypothetical protein